MGAEGQVLNYLANRLSIQMKDSLKAPITLNKLREAMIPIKCRKSPGPDGFILEFYRNFWDQDYLDMLHVGIWNDHLLKDVTQGQIALLH